MVPVGSPIVDINDGTVIFYSTLREKINLYQKTSREVTYLPIYLLFSQKIIMYFNETSI